MKEMKYIKFFESFFESLLEHHTGIKDFGWVSKNMGSQYTEIWKKCEEQSKKYLEEKGLSQEVINYWTRSSEGEHQEYIHLPFILNEKILGEIEFKFEEGLYELKDFYSSISDKTSEERDRKWEKSIKTGEQYFKGVDVKGNNPNERKKFLEESTKAWLRKPDKNKPLCFIKPWNNTSSWLLVDGGHRLWAARKLFPEGVKMHCVLVVEKKKQL